MKIDQILESKDMCNVCGQTPCNCTHVMEGADERKQNALWAQITDYEKRAKATSNDIKKQHLLKMANELRGKLKTNVDEGVNNVGANIKALYQKIYRAGDDEIEYFYNDSPIFAQYWDEYEGDLDSIIAEVDPGELQVMLDELESYVQQANLAEGEVVAFPKKHKGDLDSVDSCVKCGGDLQGGTYMGHKVKVCIPCKQVYLPPNSGIDKKGNKIEQGVAEGKPEKPEQPEADYGDDYQDMVARVKKLAGMGPLKTVYDPQKRVYKNVPTAVQPKK